jgi:hypothetical protein
MRAGLERLLDMAPPMRATGDAEILASRPAYQRPALLRVRSANGRTGPVAGGADGDIKCA